MTGHYVTGPQAYDNDPTPLQDSALSELDSTPSLPGKDRDAACYDSKAACAAARMEPI